MSEEKDTARRERDFEALLHYLRQSRGFDFSGYKRPSLQRRVGKRMQMVEVESFTDYMDYLEVHPEEFAQLFNTVLINVTSFFRDPPAWEFLARQCLPKLLAAKKTEPIRVWCAGCASGEEAYSIAMLLAEAMGPEAFRDRVKIYATDVDEDALNVARMAAYDAKALEPVEPALRKKYFEPHNSSKHVFRVDLRRSVIFGRHDLVQDAPISRLDLLLCRNTLMYFNAETQARILARFHFALNGDNGAGTPGYLFLGRAEMLLTHGNLFTPLDLKCRIFVKVPQVDMRNRILAMANHNGTPPAAPAAGVDRLQALAMDESPVPRVILDANGTLVHANQKMRQQFSINLKDLGRPFRDLEISYRPVELRSLIEQAYVEHRPVTQAGVERRLANGDTQSLDVVVAPLSDESGSAVGASITFLDVTRYSTLQRELQQSKEEIQTANEEL